MKQSFSQTIQQWLKALIHFRGFSKTWMGKNLSMIQLMELDACTHCAMCTSHCSVAIAYEGIANINILPSEKIASIRALASGIPLTEKEIRDLQEGVYLCTNCYRCTVVCPVGINLQEVWNQVRELLLQRGIPELSILSPLSYYRGLMRREGDSENYEKPLTQAKREIQAQCEAMINKEALLPLPPIDPSFTRGLGLSAQSKNYSFCFGCQTCTTVCPVVSHYENPQEVLGLLPHQIMHAAGLGLKDLAIGSNMLWDCLTCYRCQEQCPRGVPVTDILYELKTIAIKSTKEKKL